MGTLTLLSYAFFDGVILQFLYRRLLVSISVPTIALSLWILFTEFLQPYKGGGASMWPIALFFVAAYSASAAASGALLIVAFNKNGKKK